MIQRYDTTDVSTEWAMFKSDTGEWVQAEEAEDAIAERDGKIRDLEAMVERLRNCWNCKNSDVRCSYFEGPVCERWEEEKL